MLSKMFEEGSINKWRFLLSNYKLIKLSEEQLVLIMLIMNCSSADKKFITPLDISNRSNFSEAKAQSLLDELKQQGFIEIKMKKGMLEMDLSPIFTRIIVLLENEQITVEKQFLYQQIDNILDKPLNSNDKLILNKYLENQISDFQLTLILNNREQEKITFKELLKLIDDYLKNKPKSLTKYNWLTD